MTLLAIEREACYSPNHVGNDAAILQGVIAHLRSHHALEVELCSEADFLARTHPPHISLLQMARRPQTIAKLQALEAAGCRVINSPQGVANCSRVAMTQLLHAHGIPHPESVIVESTTAHLEELLAQHNITSCWLKRGDTQAIAQEDITFAPHPAAAAEALRNYQQRGITRVVINRHLVGDLVKFYGVVGSDFFYWFYPLERGHSKYGYEHINGESVGIPFSTEALQQIATQAAQCLGVTIYGGDCVVSPEGDIRIIDLNDWPSFAPCREEAAPHIAAVVAAAVKPKATASLSVK